MHLPKPQKFRPNEHGSLVKLSEKPSAIDAVKPESPRPLEMMIGVTTSGPELTIIDAVVHELLISYAYEIDKDMSAESYTIDLSALTRWCGPHARKDDVLKSLDKLRHTTICYTDSIDQTRRFNDVQAIIHWQEIRSEQTWIGYQFAAPIKELMRRMPAYVYLELSAIGNGSMHLKYSPALYKLLASYSIQKKWVPGEDNEIFFQIKPTDLARLIQFPSFDDPENLNVGKLTQFILSAISEDFQKVRRFKTSVEIIRESGRGKRIHSYAFTLRLRAPDYRHVRLRRDYKDPKANRYGGADDEQFRVRSDIWSRAAKTFNRIHNGKVVENRFHERGAFELWKVALNEAISGKALTNGYDTRSYRGEGLLQAIRDESPEYALWGFLEEESDNNDLLKYLSDRDNIPYAVKTEAEVARRKRIGLKTSKLEARAKKSRKAAEYTKSAPTDAERLEAYKAEQAKIVHDKAVEADIAAAFNEAPTKPAKFILTATDEDGEWSDIEESLMQFRYGDGTRRLLYIDNPKMTMAIKATDAQLDIVFSEIEKYYTIEKE